jgi:hypothetical protein
MTRVVTPANQNKALSSEVKQPAQEGLSEFLKDRKSGLAQGDIVRSTTKEKLGDPEHTVEFIPLRFNTQWMLQEILPGENRPQFRGYEPRTAVNEGLPWEFEKDGAQWRRVKVINCFGLLPTDITAYQTELKSALAKGEMPDLNKTLLPVVISFRSTSYNAGKAVATYFVKIGEMSQYGAQPYGYFLKLGVKESSNDQGDFFVYDVTQGSKVSKELLPEAEKWYHRISKMTDIKVDESDVEAETAAPSGKTHF